MKDDETSRKNDFEKFQEITSKFKNILKDQKQKNYLQKINGRKQKSLGKK